jgi:hypothetical protein
MFIGELFACVLFVSQPPAKTAAPAEPPNSPAFREPAAVIVPVNKNIWIDTNPKARRVLVRAYVCRQKAPLEEFMCRKDSKEHESVLAADLDAKSLQAALLAAELKPGAPARYDGEKFHPPSGEKLEITVEWKQNGQPKQARAQDWIRDFKTQKAITHEFVFAGSQIVEDPQTKQKQFLGDGGDLLSVANFPGSIVDLAVHSSNTNDALLFEAFTERIPPQDTEVIVVVRRKSQPKPAAAAAETPQPTNAARPDRAK